MIHYHGTPITPNRVLRQLAGRHFCVSYARPDQVKLTHEIGQSVMLDNGAYSAWRRGATPDWDGYYKWCDEWLAYHTTWAVIPDIIGGSEEENDALLDQWPFGHRGAPVWHLHESLGRLVRLCLSWPRVCFGSSGSYAEIGTPQWHRRICEAFDAIAPDGRVPVWVHMLRALQLAGTHYPFASADSSNVAQNHHEADDPVTFVHRIDAKQCPGQWTGATQQHLYPEE